MKIIAGPCQHENLDQSLEIAETCGNICEKYGVDYIFKASFDKANRTHVSGKRGVGIDKCVYDFIDMKIKIHDIQILTDVHDIFQIDIMSNIVDVIQIPAFLCRQTDLIKAACATDCIVNVKKGQFLAPWDVSGMLSKCEGAKQVWITERGTSFGYNNLVVDFTGIQYMLDNYDVPLFFDATHSVQKPSGQGNSSGGNRLYVPSLCRAASALGVSNFFIEVHPDPDNAPSDGPNMVKLEDFEPLVEQIVEYNFKKCI